MREEETIAEAKERRHSQTAGSYTARFSLDREIGRSSRAQTTPGRRRDATLHCEHAGGRTDHAGLPTRGNTFGGILRSSMRRARPRLIDEWERRGCDGGFVPQLPKSIVRISRTAPLDPHRQLARAFPNDYMSRRPADDDCSFQSREFRALSGLHLDKHTRWFNDYTVTTCRNPR